MPLPGQLQTRHHKGDRVTQWVLVVWLTGGFWLPVTSYETEAACVADLEKWEFERGTRGVCLPGVIEAEPKFKRRRK
jgi:hypothetical protein